MFASSRTVVAMASRASAGPASTPPELQRRRGKRPSRDFCFSITAQFVSSQPRCLRRILAFTLLAGAVALIGSAFAQEGRRTALPKMKLLSSGLPRGLEGVTIDSSGVRLKPGYRAVKQPNGGMAVARVATSGSGGAGITGTFMCTCVGGDQGACWVINNGTLLTCITLNTYACHGCTMTVIIGGVATKLMSFEADPAKLNPTVRPSDTAPAGSPPAAAPIRTGPTTPSRVKPAPSATPRQP
jgi:hypothetical protein